MYKYVELTTTEEGIATVKINRTNRRNALCRELLSEIVAVFQQINVDENVKVAILTGTDKIFVAGADIEEMRNMAPLGYQDYGSLLMYALKVIRENSKPVIGAINGFAFGGGNALVMACDLLIAAESAKFGQQEINLGFFGGAYILPKLVGRCRAAEIVMLGEAYSAHDALKMGLVNMVVANEELNQAVDTMAKKLLRKSPIALSLAKEALRFGFTYDVDMAAAHQTSLMAIMFSTNDLKEGMEAFLTKRPPAFKGN